MITSCVFSVTCVSVSLSGPCRVSKQVVSPTALDCPAGWSWFDRRCFMFLSNEMSWASAEKYCLQLDSHLASYHSTGEYNFIRENIFYASGKHTQTWVGMFFQEGVWMWSDGSKFIFSNWAASEPKNDGGVEHCMNINVGGIYYWSYTICNLIISFKCMFL
uniref:C-type lectin domain-containing protein n=1 Tax=Xiphophorus maculatus TaxID=8083 RepID=A0A3B5R4Q2_XIPMA